MKTPARRLELEASKKSRRGQQDGDNLVADEATALLRGESDLVMAAMGRRVPLTVQLGVLAHGELTRLVNLGRYHRRGSVRRAWGADMAQLAGDLARHCRSPEGLRQLQADFLIPLELDVLGRRRRFSCASELIGHVRAHVPFR
ncbi:MAG TPA: hypothetical protein VN768_05165 [Acidimicrobiales bacterium]|nr:hypothetical protein [Acidimicrobiales bacterium]